jgi:hypothetical protein
MFSHAELHLAYKVANAPISSFPYPHCYVRDVFPAGFYADMQRYLPDPEAMIPIEQARQVLGYKERFVLEFTPENLNTLPETKRKFWSDFAGWLLAGRFKQVLMSKFGPFVEARLKNVKSIQFYNEALLVQDITDYKIGPHSDSPVKVVTLLFYLPKDDTQAHLGTSIYMPKDLSFRCPGGPHYPFDMFERMVTMPFLPNSLFMFVKGDSSFHGVEPVGDPGTRRWLLLFDIFMQQAVQPQAPFQYPFHSAVRTTYQPVGAQPAATRPAAPGPAATGSKQTY